jgi:hypothetical protein
MSEALYSFPGFGSSMIFGTFVGALADRLVEECIALCFVLYALCFVLCASCFELCVFVSFALCFVLYASLCVLRVFVCPNLCVLRVFSRSYRMGRKQACVWFCITYILSCVTKHFKDYQVVAWSASACTIAAPLC